MSNSSYKEMHEAFMQNFNGTSALDTFITIMPIFFTSATLKFIILSYGVINFYFKICLEFIILIIPFILGTTVAAELRFVLFLVYFVVFCFAYWQNIRKIKDLWQLKVQNKKQWQCISYIRALVSLMTIHCILAVDFNIFPRYMAKTEKYGFSLMDTGVGLFIFCNALVPGKISKYGVFKSLQQNAKSCLLLLILGYARMTIIKEINYHEHVTEYGIHWNFFITLAITKLVATIILHIFTEDKALISGLFLLICHECLLHCGLTSWVYSNKIRDNFISANREGISSCLGYIALYLISASVGLLIRDKYNWNSESGPINRLLKVVLVSWSVTYISNMIFGVSRCLANLGYCSYVIAVGTSMLTLFYLFELSELPQNVQRKQNPQSTNFPIILHAINRNGLLFFLLGNMVTGIINILFETLLLNNFISLTIIFLYMLFMVMIIVSWENNKFGK